MSWQLIAILADLVLTIVALFSLEWKWLLELENAIE
jgi:hypothetical protein